MTRIRVAVLFGGRSAEHEISCISARSVIDAMDPERIEVIPIGITREGAWLRVPAPPALPGETGRMPEVTGASGESVSLGAQAGSRELVSSDGAREMVDVVFPVLHGPFGEDGAIQGMLELAGVPYVGAGILASAVGMDKTIQKVLFAAAGLPVVPYEVARSADWRDDREGIEAKVEALGYPVFVKPAALGSSVGISMVRNAEALEEAMSVAFRYGRKALIERAVESAREIECAVLGNEDPVASVPGEIEPQGHEFYDYEAKYLDSDGARLLIPADVKPDLMERVQRMSVAAFRAIDGAGMARVDFFLDSEDGLWINEINTIPGFTSISMYPKLWEASGVSYEELVERLIELAVERALGERGKSTAVPELGGAPTDAPLDR